MIVAIRRTNGDTWHFVTTKPNSPEEAIAKKSLIEIGPNRYTDHAHNLYWDAFISRMEGNQ